MSLHSHCWTFAKLDVLQLFHHLVESLGLNPDERRFTPLEAASVPMPNVSESNFRDQYLVREIVRKSPDLDLNVDTRRTALESFFDDEQYNALTNDRLNSLPPSHVGTDVLAVVDIAAQEIGRILGRFDEDAFWENWRFGPKSTLSISRLNATVNNKLLLEKPTINARAYGLAAELLSRNPQWFYDCSPADGSIQTCDPKQTLRVCEWDRWTSVTKNAKTDRGICIPADISVALQLSVGHQMRTRLFSAGINLNDQSINQQLAFRASCTGKSATIDVKSASQSVTCGVVYKLIGRMPSAYTDPRWYLVLDALRAPLTMVDGELHENELFSAMGNGYTFELESLIFYSLALACCTSLGVDPEVSVYGDDIILPSMAVPLLVRVFDYLGFRINTDKSFFNTVGPFFRESCGKHYLGGVDVTPFYVDSPMDNPSAIILLANNIVRWSIRKDGTRDGRLYPVWCWVVAHLGHSYLGCGIPLGEANDGLIMDWDEATPRNVYNRTKKRQFAALEGYKAKTVEFSSRPKPMDDNARYRTWLYNASNHSGFKPPKGRTLDFLWIKVRKGSWDDGLAVRPRYALQKVEVEHCIRIAPLVGVVIPPEKSVQTGMRVVTSWPRLGPWADSEKVWDVGSLRPIIEAFRVSGRIALA